MKTRKSQAGFIGDIIGAVTSGLLGQIGSDRRNEQQIASAREQMEFQAREARIDRTFLARQGGISRKFNMREALKSRQFNKNMEVSGRRLETHLANTEVRRRMRDLKLGGLNPILAAGHSASSPSIGNASGPAATSGAVSGRSTPGGAQAAIEDSMARGTATARAYLSQQQELRASRAQVGVTKAQEKLVKAQEEIAKETRWKTRAEAMTEEARTQKVLAETGNLEASTALNRANIPRSQAETERARQAGDLSSAQAAQVEQQIQALRTKMAGLLEEEKIDQSTYGRVIRWLGRLNPFSSSAKAAAAAAFKVK